MNGNKRKGSALIVGGGITGMQAALDLADAGIKVYLLEKSPGIGGVMSQLDKTFPTNDCAMCTMAPRLVSIGRHKDVEVISYAELEKVERVNGNFKVVLKKKARYVNESLCTGCGACVTNCPTRKVIQIKSNGKVELDKEFSKVAEIVKKFKNVRSPLLPILHEVNRTYFYFPKNVLAYISQELGYPLTHILRVATFYNAFSIEPRGKYVINVCMGTTCYVKGGSRLMERFSDELKIQEGQTTSDRLFTLKSVRCIGCCGLAPAVMVNEEVYGKVNVPNVKEILMKYRGTT